MPNRQGAEKGNPLLAVDEARERIIGGLAPMTSESLPLSDTMGRVLASDVSARLSLPPAAVSAMDGYAVRSGDCPAILSLIHI